MAIFRPTRAEFRAKTGPGRLNYAQGRGLGGAFGAFARATAFRGDARIDVDLASDKAGQNVKANIEVPRFVMASGKKNLVSLRGLGARLARQMFLPNRPLMPKSILKMRKPPECILAQRSRPAAHSRPAGCGS